MQNHDYEQLDIDSFHNAKHPNLKKLVPIMSRNANLNGFQYISEAMIILYEELRSYQDVADILGVGKSTVAKWVKRWDNNTIKAPYDGTAEGLVSILDIADEIGISPQGVQKVIKRGLIKFQRNWIKMFGEPKDEGRSDMDFFTSMLMHHGALSSPSEQSVISELIYDNTDEYE